MKHTQLDFLISVMAKEIIERLDAITKIWYPTDYKMPKKRGRVTKWTTGGYKAWYRDGQLVK